MQKPVYGGPKILNWYTIKYKNDGRGDLERDNEGGHYTEDATK